MATIVAKTCGGTLMSDSGPRIRVLKGTYDYDIDGAAAIGDVVQILGIPADFIMLPLGCTEIETAFNTSVTLNFGWTGGDTDGVQTSAAAAPQTAGDPVALAGDDVVSTYCLPNVPFGTADTLDIVVGGAAITQGVVHIWIVGFIAE